MSTTSTPFNRRAALDSFERMAARQKKAIGRRIKELRDEKKWTQQELASKIPDAEVDAQYVSKWERGIYTPTKHLEALAHALTTTEGDILAGASDREKGETPDVLGQLNGEAEADELLLEKLDQILDQQSELLSRLEEVRAEQADQRKLLLPASRSAAKTRT